MTCDRSVVFSGYSGLSVSSTNKIDRHYITEILLKVALKHHKPQCYVIKFKLLVVFSTNKTDCHDITDILLNVALNTITLIPSIPSFLNSFYFIINIAEILLAGRYGTINQQINSNMTSFFRFVNKRAIYRLGKISLAHVPVHVTDFRVVNVHVDELSSA